MTSEYIIGALWAAAITLWAVAIIVPRKRKSMSLTADEAKRIRIALIFGDPKHGFVSRPDPKLEVAKAKLRAIEAEEFSKLREHTGPMVGG